jgi:hypothetical protein
MWYFACEFPNSDNTYKRSFVRNNGTQDIKQPSVLNIRLLSVWQKAKSYHSASKCHWIIVIEYSGLHALNVIV